VVRRDRIRNDRIRNRVGFAPIVEKMVEIWFKWFGHVQRRLVNYVVKRVDRMNGSQITKDREKHIQTIR